VTLYAFKATPLRTTPPLLKTLFKGIAGSWPYPRANANIVPVVANGKVYVASFRQLVIFGLRPLKHVEPMLFGPSDVAEPALGPGEHDIFGTVRSVEGRRAILETRTGQLVNIDATAAIIQPRSLVAAHTVEVRGTYGSDGTLNAQTVQRAKGSTDLWPPDR
jgi:hypothetical protein